MGRSYFIWNGTDCRSMGVTLEAPAAIIKPEERLEHITIPGRSGELTLLEDEHVYQGYIQTLSINISGGYRVREIMNWLKGTGYITFSGEPDRKQRARQAPADTLDRHSKNLDWWRGEIQFYCEPLKELLHENSLTVTESGTAVKNRGDVSCRPLILLTASGTTAEITCGTGTLILDHLTSGYQYAIDCDAEQVTGATIAGDHTRYSAGDFPRLYPGNNTITGSGWSTLRITRRERYL